MSVLIKGMQIPESCSDCPLNYDMMSCIITGTRFWSDTLIDFDCQESRLYDCPLVELPEKHGRLGDLDELWERMLKYTDNEGAKFPYGDDDSMIHRDSACFMIESADTIVEAEGVEE